MRREVKPHKIREILANCDRITVMRGGQVEGTLARAATDETRLVEMMIGQRLAGVGVAERSAPHGGSVALEVRGPSVAADRRTRVVDECRFSRAAGEVAGLAGVAGNGQREVAEALLGLLTGGRCGGMSPAVLAASRAKRAVGRPALCSSPGRRRRLFACAGPRQRGRAAAPPEAEAVLEQLGPGPHIARLPAPWPHLPGASAPTLAGASV